MSVALERLHDSGREPEPSAHDLVGITETDEPSCAEERATMERGLKRGLAAEAAGRFRPFAEFATEERKRISDRAVCPDMNVRV